METWDDKKLEIMPMNGGSHFFDFVFIGQKWVKMYVFSLVTVPTIRKFGEISLSVEFIKKNCMVIHFSVSFD